MPFITTDDDVKLYFEETGTGYPVIFVHEFAGDCRSWEPQVRQFERRYRCIAFNARGWTPSDVPKDVRAYSQDRARDDIRCVLDHLKIDSAHVVGLSMGGSRHCALDYVTLTGRGLSSLLAQVTAPKRISGNASATRPP